MPPFKRIELAGRARQQAIQKLRQQMAFIDRHGSFPGSLAITEVRALIREFDRLYKRHARCVRKLRQR